jgi:hypothetical protein
MYIIDSIKMSSNDDSIYQYPEASLAKRKDTGMYLSRDEWWAMNRLGKIKGVDYAITLVSPSPSPSLNSISQFHIQQIPVK